MKRTAKYYAIMHPKGWIFFDIYPTYREAKEAIQSPIEKVVKGFFVYDDGKKKRRKNP